MPGKRPGASLKLASKDARIVELTLLGKSLNEIAETLGMDRVSVWRRLHHPKVQEGLDEARKILFRKTGYSLVAGFNEALEYLRKVVRGEEEADAVKVRAAQALLANNAFQALALEDVRREVEKVRAALESAPFLASRGNNGRSDATPSGQDGGSEKISAGIIVESINDA